MQAVADKNMAECYKLVVGISLISHLLLIVADHPQRKFPSGSIDDQAQLSSQQVAITLIAWHAPGVLDHVTYIG